MGRKGFLWGLGVLLVVGLMMVGISPSTIQAQQGRTENFIFVNYIGQELNLDLDDVTYVISGTNTAPAGGRLALQLAPGPHKYAANVPGVPIGSAGEFTLTPDGYVAKAARLEKTNVPVDRKGIVTGKAEDYVDVFDFNPLSTPIATPTVAAWQPAAAVPGMGSIVWMNYKGVDELTVDLAGKLYKVPPATNNIPGRLQIDLSPGFYRYTASVPNGSINGEITMVAGQATGLSVIPELLPEVKQKVGEEYKAIQPIKLRLTTEDLTGRVQVASASPTWVKSQVVITATATPSATLIATTPAEGLLIKNYAGDTLIFTINNQAYPINNNTEQRLSLPPGQYNYTASLPFVATTGTVNLLAGQGVELSVAINVAHDTLNVYQK